MRIGIDIRALMEGKTTGVEMYLDNLLRNIFEIDNINQYVLFANSFRRVSLPEYKYANVEMIVTRYPNKLFNLGQKLGFPTIEHLVGNIDLFFSPHWRATALRDSTPLAVTFHDLFFEVSPAFFTWRRRIWHWFMNYRAAASRANRIIAVSENTKQDLVELYGVSKSKVQVIYPGTIPANKPTTYNPQPTTYFLYFGTFEPRKNIEGVVAAYEEYYKSSKIRRPLVIAGSSGWKTMLRISAHLRGSIRIEKDVSEADKARLYQGAFAFVFPSFYEGFGFPVLEAASAGLPVLTSYNSSLIEVAGDFALFVNPFRPSEIADAMLELENDERLYDDLIRKGQIAAAGFKWENTARSTIELFTNVSNLTPTLSVIGEGEKML